MYPSSANLATQHAFGSRWYSWPLNIKPVYYWNQEIISGHPDWKAKIYFSGNPLLWWLAGMSIIFVIFKTLTSKGRRQLEPIFYILTLGYLVNWLPFILIKRVAFLYHYLPPATYAILLFSLLLTKFWTKEKTVFWALAALVVLGFVIISPLSYGWPLPPALSQPITQLIGFFN